MNKAMISLEGWYVLHDFRMIDWTSWKLISKEERQTIITEFHQYLDTLQNADDEKTGSHAFYTIIGQKADFMLMILRPTMTELQALETEFNKLAIADFTFPAYSYVSVVELSNYLAGDSDEDPYDNPYVRESLYPKLPTSEYICFYPMAKKREGEDNWYRLSIDKRQKLMYNHSMIGRQYAGKIKQVISSSVGFDDYEWAVTLFSDDVLQFKKLVYEMRFDEASARYSEFGSFFIGTFLNPDKVSKFLVL